MVAAHWQTETRNYFANGELQTIADAQANTTSYTYDTAGRTDIVTDPDGRKTKTDYDLAGQTLRTWKGWGSVQPGMPIRFAEYTYSNNGKQLSVKDASRMTTVRENSTTLNELALYGYDQLSRRATLRLGGQTTNTVTYAYEPDSNLDLLTHKLNATTMTLDYGRNNSHQITNLTASDDFYLGPTVPLVTLETYAVNRLNQYTSLTLRSMSYDGNGNLTSWAPVLLNRHTYTFDAENRLRSAAVNSALTPSIFYDYDPLGRRASKTVSGTSTLYLLDGDEEIAELNSTGAVLRRYITGPAVDDRIATVEGSSIAPTAAAKTYYHTNHQGSVLAMTDAAGNATGCAVGTNCQRLSYDEYGNLSQGSVATGQPYRYTGRRFDAETGLYYYRARYYSPDLGRFLSTDPVGYKDDQNLYAYVRNDPFNLTDPTGEFVWVLPEVVIVGSGLLAGGCAATPSCTAYTGEAATRILDQLALAPLMFNPAMVVAMMSGQGDSKSKKSDQGNVSAASGSPDPDDDDNNREEKVRKPGQSGKDAAKDAPSWAKGQRPYTGESGKQFAKRLLDQKYGPGNWRTGPGSEHNQLAKYADRGFIDPPTK